MCLTCEAKKPCFKCGVPKPEKDYGPAAWKARNADRRCCRDCVQKLRGHWSCAECLERKPHAEFTAWRESRDASQNGRQCCNTCISLALVCQIARRANKRLTPLRRREQSRRQQAIIDEVRQEILERTRQITTKALTAPRNSGKDQADNDKGAHPRNAKLQRPTARVRDRFREPCGCHRKRRQPGRPVPARAGCENEEWQTEALVPMSILPATSEKALWRLGKLITRLRAENFSVSLAALSPVAFTNTHAQRAQQSFTQKRPLAKSKPGTETLPDAHAAGKAGT